MGNTQSLEPRAIRIWNNLCALQSDSSRLQMLETLLNAPEFVNAAKTAGVYSGLLQWVSAQRNGTFSPWPNPTKPQQQQQLARIPPPKRALDTLHEAYAVLELDDTKPLTHESLRSAYRKAGFKTHPDRGGTPEAFDNVSRAHEYLQQVLDKLLPKTGKDGSDPRFTAPVNQETALAARGVRHVTPAPQGTPQLQDAPPIALNPKKLDMNVFNKLFEENKLPDPDKDDGYGDWLKSQDAREISASTQAKLRGKYNKDMFNKTFEEEAKRATTTGSTLSKYAQPSELILAPHMGTEIGAGRPAQYTNPSGNSGISYTDLKHAYGDGATFSQEVATVDTSGRPKTFEDAKREYNSAPKAMSAEEAAAVAAMEKARAHAEVQRQRRAAAHDVDAGAVHERLQRRLMIQER